MGTLRLILAISVVIHHFPRRNFGLVHAGVAVLAFFMISGFVITMVIHETYGRDDEPRWRTRFLASRLMRLFPAYLAMIGLRLLCTVVTASPTVFTFDLGFPSGWQPLLQMLSLGIIGQDLFQAFVAAAESEVVALPIRALIDAVPPGVLDQQWMPVAQAWSLGSELVFYAIAPWIVRSVPRICALMAGSLAIRFALIFGLDGYPSEIWGYYFFPSTLCFFGMGALAWHLHRTLRRSSWERPVGTALSLLGLIGVAVSVATTGGVLQVERETGYDTAGLWLAYLAFALALPFVFERWKDNPVDRAVGDLSYPLYLCHGLVIGIVQHAGGFPVGLSASEALMLTSTVAVAWLLNLFVERPVERRRRRWLSGRTANTPVDQIARGVRVAGCSLVVVLMACVGSIFVLPRLPVAKPLLVEITGDHNLVQYDRRWFGVPHGVSVDWQRSGFDADPRIVVARSRVEARRQIGDRARFGPDRPVLESTVGTYNIVRMRGRWFAVPHGIAVDWSAGDPSNRPEIRSASSRDELMSTLGTPR